MLQWLAKPKIHVVRLIPKSRIPHMILNTSALTILKIVSVPLQLARSELPPSTTRDAKIQRLCKSACVHMSLPCVHGVHGVHGHPLCHGAQSD